MIKGAYKLTQLELKVPNPCTLIAFNCAVMTFNAPFIIFNDAAIIFNLPFTIFNDAVIIFNESIQ